MGTFRIYFFGLICHVGETDTEKEIAAVVKAEGHRPFVRTEDDLLELDDYKAVRFQFNGNYDPGRARTDNLIRAYVPKLEPLMGGRVDATNLPALTRLVEYPASREGENERRSDLSVAQSYEHKAVHVGRGKILRKLACVARMTVLTVTRSEDTTMDVVLVHNDGSTHDFATISDDSCVLIGNISRAFSDVIVPALHSSTSDKKAHVDAHDEHAHHGHSHQNGEHVRHYGAILREENDFVLVAEDEEATCNFDEIHGNCSWVRDVVTALAQAGNKSSSHSECGNTTWP